MFFSDIMLLAVLDFSHQCWRPRQGSFKLLYLLMLLSFSVIDWLIYFIFCIDLVIDSYWYNFIFSFNRCSRRKNGCWGVSSCTLSTTPPCSSTGSNLLFSLHLSQVWYFFLGLFTRVTYPILFLFLRVKLRTSFFRCDQCGQCFIWNFSLLKG